MNLPAKTILPPHLTSVSRIKQCSVCGTVFPKDVKPSLSRAFRKHVEEVHRLATRKRDAPSVPQGQTQANERQGRKDTD
jgi:hypothetical protein